MPGGEVRSVWLLPLVRPDRRESVRRELVAEIVRPVEVGAGLVDSLRLSAAEHPDRIVRRACEELSAALASGTPLPEALDALEEIAGPELAAMARIGSRAGSLAQALRTLEQLFERTTEAAARIRQKWIVPGLSIGFAVMVGALMLSGPIPVLVGLEGGRLSAPLAALARRIDGPLPALLAGVIAALAGFAAIRIVIATDAGDRLVDRLPLFGSLRRAGRSALFCRSFALLLPAGVGVVDLFRITSRLVPEGTARDEIEQAGLRFATGDSTGGTRDGGRSLSPLVEALLRRPASSTQLARGFDRLADFYEAEVDRLGQRAAIMTEVGAFLLAGLFAGGLVVAMWSLYFSTIGREPF